MDFSKLTQQASSFMNKQNSSSDQGSTDPNMNTNTGDMSNTNDMSNTGMAGTDTYNSNEDYGDKGLDFIEKKTGHTLSRDQNERITDGARSMFEKMIGKTIDPKYSN